MGTEKNHIFYEKNSSHNYVATLSLRDTELISAIMCMGVLPVRMRITETAAI